MHTARAAALLALAGAILSFPLSNVSAASKEKKARTSEPAAQVNPWDVPQPAVEKLDLNAYARIREEGLTHSHVMELASALMDDIGPRLTGSPNMQKANDWTRDELTRLGLSNAHLEDWGEFGMGWQQINTWVRMTAPDSAMLIAQATPWSPATNGPVTGDAINVQINDEKDFDKYKGKLAGKIVLLGEMRDVPPVDKPLFERYTEKDLQEISEYEQAAQRNFEQRLQAYLKRAALRDKIAAFLTDEKVAGVILPSRDGKNSGGSGGTFFDDNGAALGMQPYKAEKAVK
ncbi:MAG TPA: peptidase M28, partial [Acidobacteriaceae bacterium]